MLWDGDVALPSDRESCLLPKYVISMAILISEIKKKKVKYNMLKLERREVECLRYYNNPDFFASPHASPWFHCRLRHQAHKELYAYKQVR